MQQNSQILSFFPPTTSRFSRQWNTLLLNAVQSAEVETVKKIIEMAKNIDIFSQEIQQQAVLLSLRQVDAAVTRLLLDSGFSLPPSYQTYLNLRQQMVEIYKNCKKEKNTNDTQRVSQILEEARSEFLVNYFTDNHINYHTPLWELIKPVKVSGGRHLSARKNKKESRMIGRPRSYQEFKKPIDTHEQLVSFLTDLPDPFHKYDILSGANINNFGECSSPAVNQMQEWLDWNLPLHLQLDWPSANQLLAWCGYLAWPFSDREGYSNIVWYVLLVTKTRHFKLISLHEKEILEGLQCKTLTIKDNNCEVSSSRKKLLKDYLIKQYFFELFIFPSKCMRHMDVFLAEKFPDNAFFKEKLSQFATNYNVEVLIPTNTGVVSPSVSKVSIKTQQRIIFEKNVLLVKTKKENRWKIKFGSTEIGKKKYMQTVLLPQAKKIKNILKEKKIIPENFILNGGSSDKANRILHRIGKVLPSHCYDDTQLPDFPNYSQFMDSFVGRIYATLLFLNNQNIQAVSVGDQLAERLLSIEKRQKIQKLGLNLEGEDDKRKIHVIYVSFDCIKNDYTFKEILIGSKSLNVVLSRSRQTIYKDPSVLHIVGYQKKFVRLVKNMEKGNHYITDQIIADLPAFYCEIPFDVTPYPEIAQKLSELAITPQLINTEENLCFKEKLKLCIGPLLEANGSALPPPHYALLPNCTDEWMHNVKHEWQQLLKIAADDLFYFMARLGNINFLKQHYPKNTYTVTQRLAFFKFCVAQRQVLVLSTLLELEKEAQALVDFLVDTAAAAEIKSVAPEWWDYVERLIILKLLRAQPQFIAEQTSLGHCLFERAGEQRIKLLQLLIDFSYSWDAKNKDQQTVLEAAILRQEVAVILLLANIAPFPQLSQNIITLLLWQAIDTQNTLLMKLALQWGADANQPKAEDNNKTTPFMACLKISNEMLADLLFDANCFAPESYQEYRRIRQILSTMGKKNRRKFVEQKLAKTLNEEEYQTLESTEQALYAEVAKIIEENPGNEDLTITESVAKLLAQSQLPLLNKNGTEIVNNFLNPTANCRPLFLNNYNRRIGKPYNLNSISDLIKMRNINPNPNYWPLKLVVNNLHVAVWIQNLALIKLLVETHNYSLLSVTTAHKTVFEYALQSGNVEIIQYILQKVAIPTFLKEMFDKKLWAEVSNFDKDLPFYLHYRLAIASLALTFANNETLLHLAARYNIIGLIAICFDLQINFEAENTNKKTAMGVAIENYSGDSCRDFIVKLSSFGASMTADQQKWTLDRQINNYNTLQQSLHELLKNFNTHRRATQVTMTATSQSLGRSGTTAEQQAQLKENVIQLEDKQQITIGMMQQLMQQQQEIEEKHAQLRLAFGGELKMLTAAGTEFMQLRHDLSVEKYEKKVLAEQVQTQAQEIKELKLMMQQMLQSLPQKKEGPATANTSTSTSSAPTFFK